MASGEIGTLVTLVSGPPGAVGAYHVGFYYTKKMTTAACRLPLFKLNHIEFHHRHSRSLNTSKTELKSAAVTAFLNQ